MRRLLQERALWGTTLGSLCANYTYYCVICWMPSYLVVSRGLSMAEMSRLIGLAFFARAVVALITGPVIDRWVARGRSRTLIYKAILGANALVAAVCLWGIALTPQGPVAPWIYLYELFAGASTTAGFAIVQTFAGPRATGPWVGVQNTVGNVAGMVAPALTGLIISVTGQYTVPLLLAGAFAFLGFAAWVLVVPRVEPVDGARRTRGAARMETRGRHRQPKLRLARGLSLPTAALNRCGSGFRSEAAGSPQ